MNKDHKIQSFMTFILDKLGLNNPLQGDVFRSECASWDSLAHTNIMIELENVIQRELTIEEMNTLDSVNSIFRFLNEHLA